MNTLARVVALAFVIGLAVAALTVQPAMAAGSVSLSALGTAYTEDFDTLASSGTANTAVPNGWDFLESGTNASTTYRAGTGSDSSGDTYSFGAASNAERAFGGLRSGSLLPLVGAQFTNTTGSTIASLDIAYTGEQWRLGQNTAGRAVDRLDFQVSTNATSLTTGTWTDHDSLDFPSPVVAGTVGAVNGNAASNRRALSASITGLVIPNGATFWIRWADSDLIPGADDGLSVDDFSLTPNGAAGPPTLSVNDVSLTEGNSGTTSFLFTVNLSTAAGAGGVTFDIATADGTATTADNDYVANSLTGRAIPAGSSTYTFSVLVNGDSRAEPDETFAVEVTNVTGASIGDGQGTGTIVNDDLTPIHDIQGSAHISPLAGQLVRTSGIVTAKSSNGFWMQERDSDVDANDATSEAIFVFTSSAPAVVVGDSLVVTGTVTEFRPGGSSSTNLTTTELSGPGRTVTMVSSGNTLPTATIVGSGGRTPPIQVIEDDVFGSVETSGIFDPGMDGIDFYESLEGMRLQVNDPVAVGPTNDFGEIAVLADNGAGASLRTLRGGIVIRPNDFNPERIILDDTLLLPATTPSVNTGDHFSAAAVGVLDYSFGNFKLLVTSSNTGVSGGLAQETTATAGPGELSFATFNVENLDPGDPAAKFAALAGLIVNNLRSPDLLSLEEVQDNNGATNNSVVDATATYNTLIAAIQAAGGPTYAFRQIDPVDDQDGGEPGGNIRVGLLFRTDRGLSFVDRAGGGPATPTSVLNVAGSPQFSASPGRIDPTNGAFTTSRKPLVGEFSYDGRTLFVIANHWNSKGGDQPLFGRFQPPTLSSEAQRLQQAQVVKTFVDQIFAVDPNAAVVVLGDLNDFSFSPPLQTLKGSVLSDLIETLPQSERYTYVFDGNSQDLDHILASSGLQSDLTLFDAVHVNAEFGTQASDHDPLVAQFCADANPPSLSVSVSPNTLWPPNHKYKTVRATVTAADTADSSPTITLVSVSSNEPDNGLGDGDTAHDIVIVNDTTFQLRAERSGTGTGRTYTITYQATDDCGNTTTKTGEVTVPKSQ